MNKISEDPFADEGYDNLLPSALGGKEFQADVHVTVENPKKLTMMQFSIIFLKSSVIIVRAAMFIIF